MAQSVGHVPALEDSNTPAQHPPGAEPAAAPLHAAAAVAQAPAAVSQPMQAAGEEHKPSTVDVLTQLVMQQQQQMTELMTRLMLPGTAAAQPASLVAQRAANAATAGPSSGPPRRRSTVSVPRLPSSASLRDFDAWRYRFQEFRVSERLSELPPAEQRATLLTSLDDEWLRVVRFGLPIATTEEDIDVIITAMLAHLRRQRNPVLDRRDFDTRVQERGEAVDEYLCALREIAAFCDLCPACYDDRLRDRLVVGTSDEDARRRMLEVPDLTLRKAVDICRASENAASSSTAIGGSAAVSKVSSYRRSRSRAVSPGSRSPSVSSTDGRAGPTCRRCGARPHADGAACPAASRRCRSCNQVGHFSAVCPTGADRGGGPSAPTRGRAGSAGGRRRMSLVAHAEVSSEREPSIRRTEHVADVLQRGHMARRTPRVRLQLRRANGGVSETEWTPDTGAETSALSLRSAEKMGLRGEDLRPPVTRLLNADNREMECIGTGSVTLQLGDVIRTVDVSVIRGLHSPLLSWHDCMELGILPPSFPAQIRQVSSGPPRRPAPGHRVTAVTPPVAPPPPAAGHRRTGTKPVPDSGAASLSVAGAGAGQTVSVAAALGAAQEATSRQQAAGTSPDTEMGPPVPQPERLAGTGGAASARQRTGGAPSAHQRKHQFEALKAEFPRVFDVQSTLRKMVGEPMRIELTDDAVPHALSTARNIPFCWRQDVREQLDDLLIKDIIEPVEHPTPWCHPIVPVAKRSPDGTVSGCRLTVDFTKLNRFVKRPAHPVRSPQDAVAAITPGATVFTKLDSKAGYHQVPIREEDQDLTCFITPWGRFKYKRAPMGIVSSGDVYNQRGDAALGDIPNTCKVVDDVLAYDSEYEAHVAHVRQILQRCDDHGITLNPEKCCFAEAEVEFCGYNISSTGYTADDKKIRAIKSFPKPSNITDLRSFLGLVNQLGSFSSDVAAAAEPLRQLLRPRNAWLWTPAHDQAFAAVKVALLSPPVLDFFDPLRRTVLETDAARSGGLGFCLRQLDNAGRWRLIQCGSRFLSETESRYAVIELELLALAWACRKCSIYLSGMQQFEVMTDHRPLIPILNSKSMADIENPRLQRLRERLSQFNFVATWRQGKLHAIPDALSRAPVDDPGPDDEEAEQDISHQIASMVARLVSDVTDTDGGSNVFRDVALSELRAAAEKDPEMIALKDAIWAGFPEHRTQLDPLLGPYWGLRDCLAVDDGLVVCGRRLVIPQCLRRSTLQRLHASHQGVERTKRRARQTVYWPRVDQDIANFIGACSKCQLHLPSQQKEPMVTEKTPSRVFEAVSADYFAWAGRTFLVYVDRLSGWPFVSRVTGEASARDLVSSLRGMFAATGVPAYIRTDGGPQFSARLTREFFRRWGVDHQQSTPHYPQSNGHAEAAVKAVKRLVQKTTAGGDLNTDDFTAGLLELRNTPRADGRSPAQILYGHPLRSAVPVHHRAFAQHWQEAADDCDTRAAKLLERSVERYDASATCHRPLRIRQRVLIQNPTSHLWDRTGTVTGVGSRRDYLVRLPSGRIFWRNRRFLRPLRPLIASAGDQDDSVATGNDQNHGVNGPDDDAAGAVTSEHLTCPDDAGDEGRSAPSPAEPEDADDGAPPILTGGLPRAAADAPADTVPAPILSPTPQLRSPRPTRRLSVRWSDPVSSEAGSPDVAAGAPASLAGGPLCAAADVTPGAAPVASPPPPPPSRREPRIRRPPQRLSIRWSDPTYTYV